MIVRFAARLPILELANLYREKYRGHEAAIAYQPECEALGFDCHIDMPPILADDEKARTALEAVLNRAVREAMYECARLGAERLAGLKTQ